MVDLVTLYLHSREIQRKIAAATKPKRTTATMFTSKTEPENPINGDMWLNMNIGARGSSSALRVWDSSIETWIIASQAHDTNSTSPGPGYPYRRADTSQEIRGQQASYIFIDDIGHMRPVGRDYVAAELQVQYNPTPEELQEIREELMRNPGQIITSNNVNMHTIGIDTALSQEIIGDMEVGSRRRRSLSGTFSVSNAEINMQALGLPFFGGR